MCCLSNLELARFRLKPRLHQLHFLLGVRMKWDVSGWWKVRTRVSRREIKHRFYWSAAEFAGHAAAADHADPSRQTCVQTCQSIDPTSACRLQTPCTSFFFSWLPFIYSSPFGRRLVKRRQEAAEPRRKSLPLTGNWTFSSLDSTFPVNRLPFDSR